MKKLALSALLALTWGSAMAEDVLHIYNWNNALSADTAKRFEQSCKCRLVQDYYGDNEEMLAAGRRRQRLRHGVSHRLAVSTLIKQGKTQPLNKAQLPNWKTSIPATWR